MSRIQKIFKKHGTRFLNKCFNKTELRDCFLHQDAIPYLSGRFAAKEAIAKAMGTGFGSSIRFLDIEICNDSVGRPYPTFSTRFNQIFKSPHVIVSISHCKNYASAIALWIT